MGSVVRNTVFKVAAACAVLAHSFAANGSYDPPLARFVRPMAMGEAYVAAPEGYETLYYNPAAMAGNPKFQLTYMDLALETSGDTITAVQTSKDAFKNFNAASMNKLMGKNFYAHAQFTPTLLLPYVGIGFISDHQVGLFLQNRSLPEIAYGFQQTNGFKAAVGIPVLGSKRRGRGAESDLRVGMGVKALWRKGGFRTLPITSLLQLSDKQSLVSKQIGDYGMGLGLDLGTQYIRKFNPRVQGSLGVAYTDLGNTAFSGGGQAIRQNLSMGASVTTGWSKLLSGTFSSDLRNLTNRMDWRKRTHFGVALDTPLFGIYGGLNQLFLTYGASVNLWILKVSAASYGEELGESKGDHSNRNYLFQLTMQFGF